MYLRAIAEQRNGKYWLPVLHSEFFSKDPNVSSVLAAGGQCPLPGTPVIIKNPNKLQYFSWAWSYLFPEGVVAPLPLQSTTLQNLTSFPWTRTLSIVGYRRVGSPPPKQRKRRSVRDTLRIEQPAWQFDQTSEYSLPFFAQLLVADCVGDFYTQYLISLKDLVGDDVKDFDTVRILWRTTATPPAMPSDMPTVPATVSLRRRAQLLC